MQRNVGIDDEALYAEDPQAPEFAQPQPFNNANSNATADPDVDFVHVEAEVDDAYEGRVEAMPNKSQWPQVDLGFKMYPPLLGRAPGRPKVQRQRGSLEKRATKKSEMQTVWKFWTFLQDMQTWHGWRGW